MAEGSPDYQRLADYAKERSDMEAVVAASRAYRALLSDLEGARALLSDPAMAELAEDEVRRLEREQAEMEQRLRLMLVPKDPRDERNVIVEVRAGAGGDEAGLFAADLFRMYTRYSEER